jgi:hypothetical protein
VLLPVFSTQVNQKMRYEEPISVKEVFMHPMLAPIVSIIAGVVVLIYPKVLNIVVAIYLILVGVMGLMATMK